MIPKKIKFTSKLERLTLEMEYYALAVPAKITRALATKSAVPVVATVNGSTPFRGSLYPTGGGRHSMRVKESVRREVGLKGGARVAVTISVVDRAAEISVPKDLATALRAEGVLADFNAIPKGALGFLLRKLEAAAKPETREKRIREAVEAARARREKRVDRT